MQELKLALDWTPNINHIGFFVAQDQGFYQQLGLSVEIMHPGVDNYLTTPAKKVELGDADFALCPSESIISYRTKSRPCALRAVATILREDLSAIAVRKTADGNGPAALDGKSYASYRARYEDEIVRCLVRNDGGKGEIEVVYPEKLGIWETVLSGQYDATWIFMNWETIGLANEVAKLDFYRMADYRVPYGYSPVIAIDEKMLEFKQEAYAAFLAATKAGYQFARQHSERACAILQPFVPEHEQNIDLQKALVASVNSFGSPAEWGQMDHKKAQAFLDWLWENGLEKEAFSAEVLFNNDLLNMALSFAEHLRPSPKFSRHE